MSGGMPYRACWWIARVLCKALLRLKVSGASQVPGVGGVILASNHRCYADPVIIGASTRRELHFLAKSEAFGWFVIGPLIRILNALPIRRSAAGLNALTSVEDTLKHEEAVLMFPEGTRKRHAIQLGEPKPGVGLLAARTGVPIVPLYISGTCRISRSLLGRDRVEVRFGQPVRPEEFTVIGDQKETYRRITAEVMRRIQDIQQRQGGGPSAG